ncbi:MAG: LysR family transcriptional regulator [Acidovorax sp.]|jgi:DNA-binding transcriptional LysR family regulator|nr:LysR family transcriptional regulator [Acidovorax sp.]
MIHLHKTDPVSLQLFVTAADAGSLTAAAQNNGISLAAASKRIADLEHHLEVKLLVRSKSGVVPTAAGQSLYQHALQVLARMEQLVLSMKDFESGATGQLRLAANTSALAGFLPDVLAHYNKLYPGISLDVEDMLSEEAVRAVETGVVELGIIGENTVMGTLERIVCDEDELVFLLPAHHPLARHASIDISDALQFNFVALARSSSLSRLIGTQAQLLNMPWKIVIQVRSFECVCRMVAAGLGMAVVPSKVVRSLVQDAHVAVRPLRGLALRRRLVMAMRNQDSISLPARKFVDLALQKIEHK